MNRADIYSLIDAERARQEERWGGSHSWGRGSCASDEVSAIVKAAVLGEECGEVQRAVLDLGPGLVQELIQVAAVSVAWLESIESKETTDDE